MLTTEYLLVNGFKMLPKSEYWQPFIYGDIILMLSFFDDTEKGMVRGKFCFEHGNTNFFIETPEQLNMLVLALTGTELKAK